MPDAFRDGRPFTTMLGSPAAFFNRRIIVLFVLLLAVVGPSILVLTGVWTPRAIHFQLLMTSYGLLGLAAQLVNVALNNAVVHRLEKADSPLCLRCGASTREDGGWQNCDACGGSARRDFVLDCWHRAYPFASPLRPERIALPKLERNVALAWRGAVMAGAVTIALLPLIWLLDVPGALIVVPAAATAVLFMLWRELARRQSRICDRACLRCGYSLQGLAEFACPECGYRAEIVSDTEHETVSDWARNLKSVNYWILATFVLFMIFWSGLALAAYASVRAADVRTTVSGLTTPAAPSAAVMNPELENVLLADTHGMFDVAALVAGISLIPMVLCAVRFVVAARVERRQREAALTREMGQAFRYSTITS